MTKNHRCYCCGATSNLSDHHIIPLLEGGRDALTNVVTLCEEHHNEVEGPSNGAWDRVCKLKEAIRCGRISKSARERAEATRAEKAYEAQLENHKKQGLRSMGVLLEEDKVPVNLVAEGLAALTGWSMARTPSTWYWLGGPPMPDGCSVMLQQTCGNPSLKPSPQSPSFHSFDPESPSGALFFAVIPTFS
jgi:HNH endonuclease